MSSRDPRLAGQGVLAGLCDADFSYKALLSFPRRGSQQTPPHAGQDFLWTDYAPAVFSALRELHGIRTSDYMLSLCGDTALRELATPGKSGAVFYISHDEQFLVKTVHKTEYKLLRQMLPKYFKHMVQHPHSLICRFYGLHRIQPDGGRKARFVVMGNLFCTDLAIHRRYDLKGSSLGRYTVSPRPGCTLKDLDLDESFRLEPFWAQQLHDQLEADARFLEQNNIMDYSLLLGVHAGIHIKAQEEGEDPTEAAEGDDEVGVGSLENTQRTDCSTCGKGCALGEPRAAWVPGDLAEATQSGASDDELLAWLRSMGAYCSKHCVSCQRCAL